MTPQKLNSVIALVTPIVLATVTAFQPQIQEFLKTQPAVAIIATAVITLWNNIANPVHK